MSNHFFDSDKSSPAEKRSFDSFEPGSMMNHHSPLPEGNLGSFDEQFNEALPRSLDASLPRTPSPSPSLSGKTCPPRSGFLDYDMSRLRRSPSPFDRDFSRKRPSYLVGIEPELRMESFFLDLPDQEHFEGISQIINTQNTPAFKGFNKDTDALPEESTLLGHDQRSQPISPSGLFEPENRERTNRSGVSVLCIQKTGELISGLKATMSRKQHGGRPSPRGAVSSEESPIPSESNQCGNAGAGYSESELDSLFGFMAALFLDRPDLENVFSAVSRKNRVLLGLLLGKKLPDPKKPIELGALGDFRELLEQRKRQMRNEEKLKMVYKHTLKVLKKRFEYRSTEFVQDKYKHPHLRRFLRSKNSTFYLYLFEETIRQADIDADLVMDILFETVSAKRSSIPETGNWARGNKRNAMKKISASMRYLIKSDRFARRKILDFIDYDDADGLVRYMEEVISSKLAAKKKAFSKILEKSDFDFDTFKAQFEAEVNAKSFKFPRTINEVKAAIDLCRDELVKDDDAHLRAEFLAIQEQHNSRVKRQAKR